MTLPTVVVVDDDDVDRYLVRRVAKSIDADANVIEFTDGEDFLNVILERGGVVSELGGPPPPILVLLDINMPRMGGFEVLEAIKKEQAANDRMMLVMMYSSSDHAQDRADSVQYDFVKDYIVKPLNADTLQGLIEKHYPGAEV